MSTVRNHRHLAVTAYNSLSSSGLRANITIALTVDGAWPVMWAHRMLKNMARAAEFYQLETSAAQPYVTSAAIRRLAFCVPPEFGDEVLAELLGCVRKWKVTHIELSIDVGGTKTEDAIRKIANKTNSIFHINIAKLPGGDAFACEILRRLLAEDSFLHIRFECAGDFSGDYASDVIQLLTRALSLVSLHIPSGGFSTSQLQLLFEAIKYNTLSNLCSMSWSSRAVCPEMLAWLQSKNA